jgi:hypothetical protein
MWGKLRVTKIALYAALLWSTTAYAQSPLDLSASARSTIWRSLGKDAMDTSIPNTLQVGEIVPVDMRLLSFDRHVRKRVPAIGAYSYSLLHGQVLIVDPGTKKIVAIISK